MNEKFLPANEESGLKDYAESLKKAKQLLEKFEEQLRSVINEKPFDPEVSPFNRNAIQYFVRSISQKIAENFQAHGIVRGSDVQNLAAFLNIIETKSLRGDIGQLVRSDNSFIPAYTSGPFLILSHYNQPLASTKNGLRQINDGGLAIEPGAYVVNNDFYPLVDELRRLYPDTNIIKASQLPAYIHNELSKKVEIFIT